MALGGAACLVLRPPRCREGQAEAPFLQPRGALGPRSHVGLLITRSGLASLPHETTLSPQQCLEEPSLCLSCPAASQ